jgi:hypothetical protein
MNEGRRGRGAERGHKERTRNESKDKQKGSKGRAEEKIKKRKTEISHGLPVVLR